MRVGTSTQDTQCVRNDKDHPHACGDKASNPLVLCITSGSSPCVWGQGDGQRHITAYAGIIPMRVGTRRNGKTILRS